MSVIVFHPKNTTYFLFYIDINLNELIILQFVYLFMIWFTLRIYIFAVIFVSKFVHTLAFFVHSRKSSVYQYFSENVFVIFKLSLKQTSINLRSLLLWTSSPWISSVSPLFALFLPYHHSSISLSFIYVLHCQLILKFYLNLCYGAYQIIDYFLLLL